MTGTLSTQKVVALLVVAAYALLVAIKHGFRGVNVRL